MRDYGKVPSHHPFVPSHVLTMAEWDSFLPQLHLAGDLSTIAASYGVEEYATDKMTNLYDMLTDKINLLIEMFEQANVDVGLGQTNQRQVTIPVIRTALTKLLQEWSTICKVFRIKFCMLKKAEAHFKKIENTLNAAKTRQEMDGIDEDLDAFIHFFAAACDDTFKTYTPPAKPEMFGIKPNSDFVPAFVHQTLMALQTLKFPTSLWSFDNNFIEKKAKAWMSNRIVPLMKIVMRTEDASNNQNTSVHLSESDDDIANPDVWDDDDEVSIVPDDDPPDVTRTVQKSRPSNQTTNPTVRPRSNDPPPARSSQIPRVSNIESILPILAPDNPGPSRPNNKSNRPRPVNETVDLQMRNLDFTDGSDSNDDSGNDSRDKNKRKEKDRERKKRRKENEFKNFLTIFNTACDEVSSLMARYARQDTVSVAEVMTTDDCITRSLSLNEKMFSVNSYYDGNITNSNGQDVHVSTHLTELRKELISMKRELEAKEKEDQETRKEIRGAMRSDFGKVKIDQISDKSQVLQWLYKISVLASASDVNVNDPRFVQELQNSLAKMTSDYKIVRTMQDAQSIIGYMRTTYATPGIAADNVFSQVIKWKVPKNVHESLANISDITRKFDSLQWMNLANDVAIKTMHRIEIVSFEPRGYDDYVKELNVFERELIAGIANTSHSITGIDRRKDNTLYFDNTLFSNTMTNVDRIKFYKKFAKDYAASNQRRITESKCFGDAPGGTNHGETINSSIDHHVEYQDNSLNTEDSETINRMNTGGGNRYSSFNDDKPCAVGCGVNHKNRGHPTSCDKFKRANRENRIKMVKSNNLCPICLRRKFDKHECKPIDVKECFTCKINNPETKLKHHYLICRLKAEEDERKRLQEQASKLHNSSQKETLHSTSEASDWGEVNCTGTEASMNCLGSNENTTENAGPFCSIVKQYINTEYDIRAALDKLRRKVKLVKKSVPVSNSDNNPEAKPDIDPADAALLNEVFNKPRPPEESINFTTVSDMHDVLNDHENLQTHTNPDDIQVAALKSKLLLKPIDQNHPNKTLFKNLVDKSLKCYKAAGVKGKKILSVMRYRTPMKKNFVDTHGFIKNGHIQVVFDENKDPYAVYHMQLDPGASISGCDAKLMDYLDCPLITVEKQAIHGINDVQISDNNIMELKVIGDNDKSTRLRISCLEKIDQQVDYPLNQTHKQIIMEEFKINTKQSEQFHWHMGSRVFGVFGENCNVLHGVTVDPEELGLRRQILNHGLLLQKCNFTYKKHLSVCGAIGTDPELLIKGFKDPSNTYPTFFVNPQNEARDYLRDEDDFNSKILDYAKPGLTSYSEDNIKCLLDIGDDSPSDIDVAKWRQSEEDKAEQDICTESALRAVTAGIDLIPVKDDDEDISTNKAYNDVIENEIIDSAHSDYESKCWFCNQLHEIINSIPEDERINLTKESYSNLNDYLISLSLYDYKHTLCPHHSGVVQKCLDCKEHENGGAAIKMKLKQRIMDSLTLKPDPNDNNNFIIYQEVNYLENNEEVGSLKSSMIEESLQSTESAVRRAMKNNVLTAINHHLSKMVKKGAIKPLKVADVERMCDEKVGFNFLARNYTEKDSSSTTAVRFLADSARPIPHTDGKTLSSVTAGPKGDINSLQNAGILFHMNQNHVETDLSSAYWSIKVSIEVGMLTLSVWYHLPETFGTDQPILLCPTAKEFGIGDSGSVLKSGIEKFVVPDIRQPFLAKLVSTYGYVDNFPVTSLSNTRDETLENVQVVKGCFKKYNLDLNKSFVPHHMIKDDAKNDDTPTETNLYGLKWNLETDHTSPLFTLNVHKKIKGRSSGKCLEDEDLNHEKITVRDVARLTSEIYSVTGRDVGPSSHSARLLLSTCCMLNKSGDIDKEIVTFSPEMAEVSKRFFHGLRGINKVEMKRFCVPENFHVTHVVIDHDGSDTGYAASARIVSVDRSDPNNRNCAVIAAKSCVSRSKTFNNETKSFGKAVDLALAVIDSISVIVDDDITVIFVGDNKPSVVAMNPNSDPKTTVGRNMKMHVHEILNKLTSKHSKMTFIFSWMDGCNLPCDLMTKFSYKTVQEQNSVKWINGPKLFLSINICSKFSFLTAKGSTVQYTQLPDVVIKNQLNFPEIISICHGLDVMKIQETLDFQETGNAAHDNDISVTQVSLDDVITHMTLLTSTTSSETINITTRSGKNLLPTTLSPPDNPDQCERPSKPRPTSPAPPTPPTPPPSPPPVPEPEPESEPQTDPEPEPEPENTPDTTTSPPPTTPAAASFKYNWPKSITRAEQIIFEKKLNPLTHAFYTRKKIPKHFSSFWQKLSNTTGICHSHNKNPLVTPSSEFNLPINMDQSIFLTITSRCSDIGKAVRVSALIIHYINNCRKTKHPEPSDLITACLAAMIRTNQLLFPPIRRPPDLHDFHGIIFHRRNIRRTELFSTNHPWFSRHDSPITSLLLRWCHVDKNALSLGIDNHHGNSSTIGRLNTGAFSCFVPNTTSIIQTYIEDCTWCNRSSLKTYRVLKGATYTKISSEPNFFEEASFDPLGAILVSPFKNSKKKIKVYPIIFKCLNTGCICLTIAETIDQTGIVGAIRRVAYIIGNMPKTVTTDAQPSFSQRMLNSPIPEGTLFGNTKFVKHLSKAQFRNYAESSVNLVKKMWRKMIRASDNESVNKLSSLTILELMLLLDIVAFSVNMIPYSPSSPLSPAHWRHAGAKLNVILPEPLDSIKDSTNSSFAKLEETLLKYQAIIREERKITLYESEHRYKEKLIKNGNKSSGLNLEANRDDIVIFDPDNKLGIIEGFQESKEGDKNTTVILKTSKGKLKRATASVHPLYHLRSMSRAN